MVSEHIKYRRCKERDSDALKHLWPLCFTNDSPNEIDTFFARIYPICVPFAAFDGDKPISMLYLLPAQVRNSDECVRVWYLYAGGTHPSYRSNGYYRHLMNVARDWAVASDGVAIYLRPAEQSLFQYYSSLGYVEPIFTYTCENKRIIHGGHPISVDEYLQRRATMLGLSAYLWDPIHPVLEHFLTGDRRAVTDDDGAMQLVCGSTVCEQLPHTMTDISQEIAALWIPTHSDQVLIDRIRSGISYSLFFGE